MSSRPMCISNNMGGAELSDSQKELVEKNHVDALVRRRNSDKVYIWPMWSSQLAGDKSGNPSGKRYSDMKEYLNMMFDSISHYLIHISYREEPTESSKDKPVLIAWGKGGFACAGVYPSWVVAKKHCYGIKYARYWQVNTIAEGWKAMNGIYNGIKSPYAARKLLYPQAPSILTNLDLVYAPAVLDLPPFYVQMMYKSSMLQGAAYSYIHKGMEEVKTARDVMTLNSRERKDLFLAIDNANEVKEINDIETDYKIYVDSASRSNYYNSPAMVTTTAAVVAKPFPRVPTLPDNGGPFANGFIPPYEDHKSDNDDLKLAAKHDCNKRCMMKVTKEYSLEKLSAGLYFSKTFHCLIMVAHLQMILMLLASQVNHPKMRMK